jgi:hypothetical protein
MPRRRSTTPPSSTDEDPQRTISYRPSKEVAAALANFIAKFEEYPPEKSKIIERALRMYLQSKGYTFDGGESEH